MTHTGDRPCAPRSSPPCSSRPHAASPSSRLPSCRSTASPPPAELTATITALDTELFRAYNHCADPAELARFAALFTDDVEFYHDQPGASTFGLPALTAAIRKNICGKVTRELLPDTLHVYPMHGYGAIEVGRHRFFHSGSTASAGEADFVHLWHFIPAPSSASPSALGQPAPGQWKLARVLSYDHNAAH